MLISAITTDVDSRINKIDLTETPTVTCVYNDKFYSNAHVIVDRNNHDNGLLVLSYMWTAGARVLRQWAKQNMCRVAGWKASYGEWMGSCEWNRGQDDQLMTYMDGGSNVVGVRLDRDVNYPSGTWFAGNIIASVIRA